MATSEVSLTNLSDSSLAQALDEFGETGAKRLKTHWIEFPLGTRFYIQQLNVKQLEAQLKALRSAHLPVGQAITDAVRVLMAAALLDAMEKDPLWSPSLGSGLTPDTPEQESFNSQYKAKFELLFDCLLKYVATCKH